MCTAYEIQKTCIWKVADFEGKGENTGRLKPLVNGLGIRVLSPMRIVSRMLSRAAHNVFNSMAALFSPKLGNLIDISPDVMFIVHVKTSLGIVIGQRNNSE
jgi:hypothetical protein